MSTVSSPHQEKKLNRFTWVISIIVFLLVLLMRRYKIETSIDFSFMPAFYSALNTVTFFLLLFAFYFIRYKKNRKKHRQLMMVAMGTSILFLMSYVVYHFTTDETLFCREGAIRYVYFSILITHVVLAAVILPFILFTYIRAYTSQFERHKKMAHWVFPLWLYVTISGPICYLFLMPCYS